MGSDPIYFADAIGTRHAHAAAEARIACLVPSITELLCDLGLAGQLVARTGFCIHPRAVVERIPKVGGTKDVHIARLRELALTHVIVNIDENEKPTVEEIAQFVPHVIVTHPNAPLDNLALYRLIGGIFNRAVAAEKMAIALEAALGALLAASSVLPRERVLYLIWKDPWMTVVPDTYIGCMLAAAGWDALECAPAGPAATPGAARYPQVELENAARDAQIILLSTEPFRFRDTHVAELQARLPGQRIALIDGEMTSWYGSRAICGLRYLAAFRAALAASAVTNR